MRKEPKPVGIRSEGQVSASMSPDGLCTVSAAHDITADLVNLRSVGIENLADIEVHEINRLYNSTSHYIKFFGGGEVKFSYSSTGKLLDLIALNVTCSICNGDQVVFRRKMDG